ncbi:MAG: ATP synthase F1 subunit epsilon [Bacteroidia bacterium]
MLLEIITPDKRIFEDEINSVVLPGIDGSFGILKGHAPMISALKKGKVKVTDKSSTRHQFDIEGGVVEVLNNKVIVLAE